MACINFTLFTEESVKNIGLFTWGTKLSIIKTILKVVEA